MMLLGEKLAYVCVCVREREGVCVRVLVREGGREYSRPRSIQMPSPQRDRGRSGDIGEY